MAQDSTTIVRLHRELATSELRVSGAFGRVELLHSEIGPGGISYYPGTARLASPDSISVTGLQKAPTWSDISRIENRVSEPVATAVTPPELPPVLPWSDIQQIEKRGSATGRGALIGGGVMLFLAVTTIGSNDGCSGLGGAQLCTAADAATILLVPVGAGIGALIGSGSHRWKTVYRHP